MLILVLCSEPAPLPGRCCWLMLQRSVREEGNYKLLDTVLEVPSSKQQEQVTGDRINPVKVKKQSEEVSSALGFCQLQQQQGVLSTMQARARLCPPSWRLGLPKAKLSISSCSLRGLSTVLLTRHTLHRTLLQMGVALWGPVSIASGREKGRGRSNFVNFGILFHKGGNGIVWSMGLGWVFLFFTIFCGIAKFSHLRFEELLSYLK